MEIIILALLAAVLALLVVQLVKSKNTGEEELTALKQELRQMNAQAASDTQQAVVSSMSAMGQTVTTNVHTMGESVGTNVRNLSDGMSRELKAMQEREDLKYVSDLMPAMHEEYAAALGTRYFATPKKMGAQTAEANINAGLAAARQIVAFFKDGVTKFQVNK